jgi:hypothetical protein
MKNIILICTLSFFSIMLHGQQFSKLAKNTLNGGFWVLRSDQKIITVTEPLYTSVEYPGGGLGLNLGAYRGLPLVVGTDNAFWQGNGSGWVQLPGGGTGKQFVADGKTGKLWCIGSDDGIWSYKGRSWTEFPGDEHVKDLVVFDNTLYVIGRSDNKIYKSKSNGSWEQLAGGTGKRVTIDIKTGKVWCIGSDDGVWRFETTFWKNYGGKGKEIMVYDNIPYVIAPDTKSIWKLHATDWMMLGI